MPETTPSPGAFRVLLFGATGMVGQGVLRECLADPGVAAVTAVGRAATGVSHPKLTEVVRGDLFDLSPVEERLTGFDACFYCLGVSAAGMSEAEYTRLTYDLTLSVAGTLARRNPAMTFVYVSGLGTDGTEKGRVMWARVKGRTENALARLPFRAVFLFRPGVIRPVHGARSRTPSYRVLYALTGPVLPVARWLFPGKVATTGTVGRAMLAVARHGAPKAVLGSEEIEALARGTTPPNAWGLAIRPRTLPAAAAGVAMGSAVAWADGLFRLDASLACLAAALLLQIGSNLANDIFDFERGTDTPDRLGPVRVTQAGLLTPAQVKGGMALAFALAALPGLYLAWLGGLPIVVVGIASILAAIAYTGGPFPLGYHGLGELFVFLFFGLASVAGTYYVQAGVVSAAAWAMSVPTGLLVTAILVVNNLRDVEEDRRSGKRTLAVRLGERATKAEYVLCLVAAYLALPLAALLGLVPWAGLAAWLSLPLALRAARVVGTRRGRPLNEALALTGRAALAFSVLFWVGMLLALRAR